MSERSVITGRVVDVATGTGVAGLRVEALDAAGSFRDLVGYARTDADGRFRMEARRADLVPLVGRRAVVASLRVLYTPSEGVHQVLVDTRHSGPKWPLDGTTTNVVLRAGTSRALSRLPALLPFVVSGTVCDEDGPMEGVTVHVFDRQLNEELPTSGLASGTTDARGRYRITYAPPSTRDLANLVVRAVTTPVTDSATRCHAPPALAVNLVQSGHQYRGPSTYTGAKQKVESITTSLELGLGSLTSEHHERLACSLRLPVREVAALSAAHAIANASSPLAPEVAFGAMMRGLGTDRNSFFQHPKSAVKQALTAAVRDNQVPQRYARQEVVDVEIENWVLAAAAWSLEPRQDPCGLAEILTVAGVTSAGDRSGFAEQFCRNEAPMPAFWDNLRDVAIDKGRLQLTLQWWSLTRGHLPLLQALEARRSEGEDTALADLARLSESDWLGILDTLAVGAPPSIPGADATERKVNYARVLHDSMVTAFPTTVFGHRVMAASAEPAAVRAFFPTHWTFEFGKHRLSLEPYKATVDAMVPADRKHLRAMERLFRLSPRYEHVSELQAKGYDSAHSVYAAGKAKFVTEMGPTLGAEAAEKIFIRACWQVGAASAAFAQFGLSTHKLPVKAFASFTKVSLRPKEEGNQIPDYATLFGGAGGCSCTHCAGVLGPAAYLTDSLAWLDGFASEVPKNATTNWSALDLLVGSSEAGWTPPPGRRPDLALLELTCKSAHTPMPYIDLVNEILEVAVAKDAGFNVDLGPSIKSSYEPEELAASPEILYEQPHLRAWRSLMERRHPFTLPECLFDREADAYLGYLGVTRADIVDALPHVNSEVQKNRLAKARLGVRDDSDPSLLSGWRLLSSENTGTAEEHWGGQTAMSLRTVPLFLRYSGLTFPELEELLATRYVNGASGDGAAELPALRIEPADGCDTATMTLPALVDGHLLRLHRFLRLRHHTGLSSTELDLLVAVFHGQANSLAITESVLQHLTEAVALAKDLKLTVPEVAALFADLDVHERWEKKSPYRRYFLNRLVDNPPSEVFTAVLTNTQSTANLSLHKTALQQGLGISENDLMLLVNAERLDAELLLPWSQAVYTEFESSTGKILDGVSRLFRSVRFARALGLSIADYLVLRAYSGLTPIGTTSVPSDARQFVEIVRALQAQRLRTSELQYILRAFGPAGTRLAPPAADIEALRAEIASAVLSVNSATETTEDPANPGGEPSDGEGRAFALLGQLLWNDQTLYAERDRVFQVLQGADNPPDDGTWRGAIDRIARYLPGDVNADGGAKDLLAGPIVGPGQRPPFLCNPADRFAYVAKWLDRFVRASRAVIEKVAAFAKLPVATTAQLLTSVLHSQTASDSYCLLDDFLPANKPEATAEQQRQGLLLVQRHARLILALGAGEPIPPPPDGIAGASDHPGEVLWLYPETSVTFGLHDLPATQPAAADLGDGDRARFALVVQLARRFQLRDRMAGGADALREMLETPSGTPLSEAQGLLSKKSGWDLASIKVLCDHFLITLVQAESAGLLDDANLLKLERGVALIRRLGIAPEEVLAFLNLEAPPPAVQDLGLQPTTTGDKNARDLVIFARRAAKAKLSAEQWGEVAQKIRAPFRELLRDRLVDALVPKKQPSRRDLYGFHLIDVDMSACMRTSRIVQATNAVQVFVQRAFLGLEDDVKLPPQATQQWEWRKSYRVWEANRKVFLWPENWLEPELREDMTPLFRDFLTHLSSGEITDAAAERALEKYLTGLDEIARLEPMALAYDAGTETDHVLARTRSQPRKWFYRRRERNLSWTAWQKVDVDIDAESVLLVLANRRLYAFWPQVVLKNDPRAQALDPAALPPTPPQAPAEGYRPDSQAWEEYIQDLEDYGTQIADWEEKNAAAAEAAAEQSQHFEVRVAWSSLVDAAWTPRRISDCPALTVPHARGETPLGYEPRHIVLTQEPQATEPPDGQIRLLCVATPWFPLLSNQPAGRFSFEACAGGRWTSTPVDPTAPGTYEPTAPENGRLSRMGFEQWGGDGSIRVRHVPVGQTDPKSVDLMSHHMGRYVIVTPPSYSATPTHFFDRFTLDDSRRVFFARTLWKATPWTEPSSASPGSVAVVESPDDKLASPNNVSNWAVSQVIQMPLATGDRYFFELFEHPHVCEFGRRLATGGVPALLGWKDDPLSSAQFLPGQDLQSLYGPTNKVLSFPKEDVSFELTSAFGTYNWELFFHIPFTIAQRLSQEGRYAEAQKWFHYIFNPTTGLSDPSPRRYWCVKPFYEIDDIDTIQHDLTALAAESSFAASLQAFVAGDEATQKAAQEMKTQIAAMAEHPFAPHVLARLRPLAYMKNVFMRYLQNLLDWADSLFRRDTMESIHEALTLYLLAADLLGPKPDLLTHKADPEGRTFTQLRADGIDKFGNAAVDVEPLVPQFPPVGYKCSTDGPPVPDFRLYFCIPPNDQLHGYWETVADRLFKIRNCMNIEGVVRELPLFAPPIDPAILVRAFAAGVRLDQVLDALAAPSPLFRFVRLHAKAVEFAAAVKELGQGLLATMEKDDAEAMALLRQRHESAVLDAERGVRQDAIREAKETLAGLNRGRQIAAARLQHYTELIDRGMIQQEKDAEKNTREARFFRQNASDVEAHGSLASIIPDISTGMLPASQIGGRAVQLASSAAARGLSSIGDALNTDASLAQTSAGHTRRLQDWKLQKSLADKEVAQHDRQIAAQEIRLAMAERELENLDRRREQAREVDDFLRTKLTNQELYTWMKAQVGSEHYRAYQLAFDMAKKAERAYQLERGDESTTFVRFGAWDSLKHGLLAGERLLSDLRALDAAYLSRSDREREITKHLSLAEIAGEQLTALRDTGVAELDLATYLFDADYPGHYFRRIKTVSLTVATVKPAADGVQCELTLLQSAYRKTSQIGAAPYPGKPYDDDLHRFSTAAIKGLATSTAEADAGLFELSLKDEMLLPFEGSGAVSHWRIEIDPKTNRFPLHRISDVVLHLRYTAKDGGAGLRGAALQYAERTDSPELNPENPPNGLKQRTRVFSARRDFDEAWAVFTGGTLLPIPPESPNTWVNRLELRFAQRHFRSFFGNPKVKIVRVQVSATFNDKYNPPADNIPNYAYQYLAYALKPPGASPMNGTLKFRAGEPSVSHDVAPPLSVPRDENASAAAWIFDIATASTPTSVREEEVNPSLLVPDAFEDIWFTVTYEKQS